MRSFMLLDTLKQLQASLNPRRELILKLRRTPEESNELYKPYLQEPSTITEVYEKLSKELHAHGASITFQAVSQYIKRAVKAEHVLRCGDRKSYAAAGKTPLYKWKGD